MTIADDAMRVFVARRLELVEEARALVREWMAEHAGWRFAPYVRVRGAAASISWRYRWFKPDTRPGAAADKKRVFAQYIRTSGANGDYNASCFRNVAPDDLERVMAMEARLQPIRTELRVLGQVMRALHVAQEFYKGRERK